MFAHIFKCDVFIFRLSIVGSISMFVRSSSFAFFVFPVVFVGVYCFMVVRRLCCSATCFLLRMMSQWSHSNGRVSGCSLLAASYDVLCCFPACLACVAFVALYLVLFSSRCVGLCCFLGLVSCKSFVRANVWAQRLHQHEEFRFKTIVAESNARSPMGRFLCCQAFCFLENE